MTNPLVFDISRIPRQLRESDTHGKGAAEIGWGTDGDFDRCRAFLRRHDVPERMIDGECATLHHEATGFWPGKGRSHHGLTAAAEVHTGAMIALVPTEEDAQRLAMDGGEPVEDLHVTLCYLGQADNWTQAQRLTLAGLVAQCCADLGPIQGDVFAVSYFNPGDANDAETALVYGIGGSGLNDAHMKIGDALTRPLGNDVPAMVQVPEQHQPWVAHMTAAYTTDLSAHTEIADRMGPVTFDRVRLAFGNQHYDIPLDAPAVPQMLELTASMGVYQPVKWRGPLAPIGRPTGDRRIFPAERISQASFPQPLRWQEQGMPGHNAAVVVGAITHAQESVWDGEPSIVGEGYFLNPDIIPEVTKAIHLIENGVAGPSVDLDSFTAEVGEFGGEPIMTVSKGRQRAATLVSIPAFADLRLQLTYPQAEDEPGDLTASAAEFANVNATGWHGAPIAPRDAAFDADEAIARIEAHAGIGTDAPDQETFQKMFLWVDPNGAPLDRSGYRLPWGDIFDGKPHLVYHAIYAAAALLEGGHGGLPNIPDADKARLRSTISEIYQKLAAEFGDPNIQASWDRAAEKAQNATTAGAMSIEEFALTTEDFSVKTGVRPPLAVFANPNLTRPTKPRIVDGRYFGHLCLWDTCHLSFDGVCVKPVRSKENYKYLKGGTFTTAEGQVIDGISKIFFDGLHAPTRRGMTAAMVKRYYEDTTKIGGYVCVYEDEFGLAFSGIAAPWLDDAALMRLQASEISGHWHPINNHLELLAGIAVNRAGFPITASADIQTMGTSGTIIYMEDGVQTGLIVPATFDAEPAATEAPVVTEDCGCPTQAAIQRHLDGPRLPTLAETQALRARLATHLT